MKTVRALSVVAFLSLMMIACQKTSIQQTEQERQTTAMTLTGIDNTVPGEPCADGPYIITLVRKQLITEGPLAGKWEWIWSVVNKNPGNGTNGTVQDLSHWGITLPECLTLANIHLAKAYAFNSEEQTESNVRFYNIFTPKYEADKSFDANGNVCPGTEAEPVMLKFDYGTFGSLPTYYALVIDKDLPVDPTGRAFYKSGNVTGSCEICFPGIGCEEPCVEGCSFSQGYYFSKPNYVWPSSVTVGGYVYTQAEGKAIWDAPNRGGIADAKKAFLQVAAIKLSGASVGKCATVWADVKIIEDWLKSLNTKLTPANIRNFSNPAAAQAAGRMGIGSKKTIAVSNQFEILAKKAGLLQPGFFHFVNAAILYIQSMKRLCVFLLVFFLQWHVLGQVPSLYEKQLFVLNEDTLRCRILTPLGFSPQKKYPLVIFLHGSGERGSDNDLQLTWGADLFADSLNRVKYQAVVIFPQCPLNDSWSNNRRTGANDSLGGFTTDTAARMKKPMELLMHFIDTLVAHGGIDPQRIYLGGLSMGGFGAFEALWRRPDLFAAAFPICGGGAPGKASAYAKGLPIWIFHGDADPIVPVSLSRQMRDALQKTTAKIRYTEYPGVGHESWKNAFLEKELLPWLFSQQKQSPKKKRK